VTKGIPRLKELLNCSSNIKTPILKCKLLNPDLNVNALKEMTIKTFLDEILVHNDGSEISKLEWVRRFQFFFFNKRKMNYSGKNWIQMKFSKKCSMTMLTIRERILEQLPGSLIICSHSSDSFNELFILLMNCKELWSTDQTRSNINAIMNLHIAGIPNVKEIIVEKNNLFIPNILFNLEDIYVLRDEIDLNSTYSNSVVNTNMIFGIEAAREVLFRELKSVLGNDGAYVNPRHITIICDSITHLGILRPMSRHGLFLNKRSALSNASFEMCSSTFNNAAMVGNTDLLNGIAEQIIVGKEHNFGTGMVDLIIDEERLLKNHVVENEIDFPPIYSENSSEYMSPDYYLNSPLVSPFESFSPNVDGLESNFSPEYSPSTPSTPPIPPYSPASPAYSPSTPYSEGNNVYQPLVDIPKNDWREENLLENIFG